jgi:hypothetical protein
MLLQLSLLDDSVVALVHELQKRRSLRAYFMKIMGHIILLSALAFIPGPYKLNSDHISFEARIRIVNGVKKQVTSFHTCETVYKKLCRDFCSGCQGASITTFAAKT